MSKTRRTLAVLTLTAVLFAMAAPPPARAQLPIGVHIDPLPFYNSVPHEMIQGRPYKLIVVLINNGTLRGVGYVVMNFDQDYFSTTSPDSSFTILPGDTKVLNFTVVPISADSAPLNLSAILYVAGGATQVVTARVESISHDPLLTTIAFSVVAAGLAVVAVYAAVVLLRRRGPSPRPGPEPQNAVGTE
jgi:hypothetical protein